MRGGPPASATSTDARILGREGELARLRGFLGSGASARCFVLWGEPGMGKTTLWERGIESARERGFAVLAARAAEAETRLSFAALGDLVDGIDDQILGSLPGPQRRVIDVALRRVDAEGTPPDPLAVCSAFIGAIRVVAACQPLVVALDDVQWLDSSSADVLAFAARRGGRGIRFLLSRRADEPAELERVLETAGVLREQLGPLSAGVIARLLSNRLGLVAPRRLLRQLYEASGGNPLFALELGRLLATRGPPEIGTELPLPDLLADVFGPRVRELSPSVRRALLAVSLSAGLRSAQLAAVVEPGAIADAERSGVLVVERSQVRPSHPLVATSARQQSTAAERQQLHRALAAAVSDPVVRARHLASASPVPDTELAETVAAAGRLAAERGAAQEAEELARQAFRLTPAGSAARAERLLTLAAAHLAVGDLPRAADLLTTHFSELPAGSLRARGHLLLGEAGDLHTELAEIELAIAEAGDDGEVRVAALTREATLLANSSVERVTVAENIARTAVDAARAVGPAAEARALPALAWTLVLQGRSLDELLPATSPARGASLYETSLERPIGVRHAFRGETADARRHFTRLVDQAELLGELRSVLAPRMQLCELALRCGDVVEAERHLDELRQWTALGEMRIVAARLQAVAGAVRGDREEAIRWATVVLETPDPEADPSWDRLEAERALGLAALFAGDASVATQRLRRVWDHTVRHDIDDPGAFPVAGDLVEAMLLAGDAAGAHGVLAPLRRASVEQRHPWGLATSRRCEAFLQLREGLLDAGVTALEGAAAAYGDLGLRFEEARTLYALARALRRGKKTGAARRALERSAGEFAALGCHGWAAAAAGELGAPEARGAGGGAALTPRERRVVDLAVGGLSNKEIAGKLEVSVYTVEEHLSHAYAKLGIRSRAQLAGVLAPPD